MDILRAGGGVPFGYGVPVNFDLLPLLGVTFLAVGYHLISGSGILDAWRRTRSAAGGSALGKRTKFDTAPSRRSESK